MLDEMQARYGSPMRSSEGVQPSGAAPESSSASVAAPFTVQRKHVQLNYRHVPFSDNDFRQERVASGQIGDFSALVGQLIARVVLHYHESSVNGQGPEEMEAVSSRWSRKYRRDVRACVDCV